jgi:hypothetical protein
MECLRGEKFQASTGRPKQLPAKSSRILSRLSREDLVTIELRFYKDAEKSQRVVKAMLRTDKIEIAALKRAHA